MRFALACMFAAIAAPACAGQAGDAGGRWTVDLSTDPAQPYTKPMALTLAPDGSVTGSFYDSAIEGGRWKTDRGRTCLAFRTTDGVGPYHSSACLRGDRLEGQTWAEHRAFLFNWNAVRAE
ncbi:hypothetical protein [Sphingomonas baiyangensis]|uniref:Extracellular endo-alpha-(1->5)-L-arabinanase C-terminal domain-containing protein n=1 Tax=Sphingomonas baiyangensis TaxID=2572576 RepID=A0A4U1L9K0_9SPHN|nr:hypothetical protein [Sphingomonas baiyangensis]TKD53243.1 hypothetical protein FBR43_02645 [Sphingomonas baiyangensis]